MPATELASTNSTREPYFLFVGRLEKLKGIQTLIPIFRDYPKAKLLIAGKGTHEETLRALAGPNSNIQFLGRLPSEELRALYEGKNIKSNEEVIAYCRIGERSSLTWFVLKYLFGYPNVKNYDGSWTEWGNLVDAPIEK